MMMSILPLTSRSTKSRLIFQCSLCSKRFVRGGGAGGQLIRSRERPSSDQLSDPYRFNDVSNIDIAGEYVMKSEDKKWQQTWMQLNAPRKKLANEPVTVTEIFGETRRDSDNIPRFHGQFNPTSTRPAFDVKDYEEALQEKLRRLNEPVQVSTASEPEETEKKEWPVKPKEPIEVNEEEVEKLFPIRTTLKSSSLSGQPGHFHFDYSEEWLESLKYAEVDESTVREYRRQRREVEERQKEISILEGLQVSKDSPLKSLDDVTREISEMKAEEKVGEEEELLTREEVMKVKLPEEEEKKGPKTYEDLAGQEMSGYEFVKGLRKGTIESKDQELNRELKESSTTELDSQGFQSYKNYALNLTTLRRSELLWLLKKHIIFCDSGILAINKPYGLIVQGKLKKHEAKHHDPVLTDLLDEFAELLVKENILPEIPKKIHPVHRLDKESTGCLVLATNPDKAHQLQQLFEKREVTKTYLTITRGVPDNYQGIIDIPIELGSVDGKERMVLRPELREELRRIVSPSKMARRAVTNYRVIDWKPNTALLEVTPETGVKHQIRVHLGFALRTPILGDHKYTYLDRIAPQKLPNNMLTSLNVRPSKVRNIPMHLHALTMILPGVGADDRNVFLRAPVPLFFRTTMKRLKLRM